MNFDNENLIGIVGGMGPHAGLTLFNSILCHTKASVDQQHLSTILMSFPGYITDRTAFLEGQSVANPAYNIAGVIRKLENAGAAVIGIACNTSYAPPIYNVITEELFNMKSKVKLVNMPMETCQCIRNDYPQVNRVGVLTTNGTYNAGIYKQLLTGIGYEVIIPDPIFQNDIIHKMIYDKKNGIKANAGNITREVRSLLKKAISFFESRRTEAIILGCTDLSVLLTDRIMSDMAVIDSTESLAKALIREATGYKMINKRSGIHSC
jgi:aspartate racemase